MAWRTVTEGFEADLYKVPTPKFFYTEQGDRGRLNLRTGDGQTLPRDAERPYRRDPVRWKDSVGRHIPAGLSPSMTG
jgi:hypothetical protein